MLACVLCYLADTAATTMTQGSWTLLIRRRGLMAALVAVLEQAPVHAGSA
jgi:hypothetical protein